MTRIVVVDHGAGNLVSIAQGLAFAGAEAVVTADPEALATADGVVLPGVGATGSVMAGIEAAGLAGPLRGLQVPLLGICVGMQVLFDWSEEDGARCLGVIPGVVQKLRRAPRLPHIGWNDVTGPGGALLAGTDRLFYFVHSFAPVPADPEVVVATTEYGEVFVSAVERGRVFGVQFHPERSGSAGLEVLANFVGCCREARVVA